MAEARGMSIVRQSDTSILIRAYLTDSLGAKITSGTTTYRLWHVVPTTGALETYDFSDNTFKTTAVTTATAALTHRTVENGGRNTGVWTARHATLTAFVVGDKYIVEVSHTSLPNGYMPPFEFQYGDTEGDLAAEIFLEGSVSDATPAAGDFDGNSGLSATNSFYNNQILVFRSGALKGVARKISAYVGASKNLSFTTVFPAAPANGDRFTILATR